MSKDAIRFEVAHVEPGYGRKQGGVVISQFNGAALERYVGFVPDSDKYQKRTVRTLIKEAKQELNLEVTAG